MWVQIPLLPLIFWVDSLLKDIENKLGLFIDQIEPKGKIFSCAQICMEVDLEKGLHKALQINLEG